MRRGAVSTSVQQTAQSSEELTRSTEAGGKAQGRTGQRPGSVASRQRACAHQVLDADDLDAGRRARGRAAHDDDGSVLLDAERRWVEVPKPATSRDEGQRVAEEVGEDDEEALRDRDAVKGGKGGRKVRQLRPGASPRKRRADARLGLEVWSWSTRGRREQGREGQAGWSQRKHEHGQRRSAARPGDVQYICASTLPNAEKPMPRKKVRNVRTGADGSSRVDRTLMLTSAESSMTYSSRVATPVSRRSSS